MKPSRATKLLASAIMCLAAANQRLPGQPPWALVVDTMFKER